MSDFKEYYKVHKSVKSELSKGLKSDWVYNYGLIEEKGYSVLLKDIEHTNRSRVHIKIPYHYVPPMGNPDLMDKFENILIPPDRWGNILGFYKNGKWTKIRRLI